MRRVECIPLILSRKGLSDGLAWRTCSPMTYYNSAPTLLRNKVRCGDMRVYFSRHHDYLTTKAERLKCKYAMGYSPTHPDLTLQRIAKAMVCGRIVGARDEDVEYERSWYCQQSTHCSVCCHMRHQRRSEIVADRLDPYAGYRCYGSVFRPRLATSFRDCCELTKLSQDMLGQLVGKIDNWNRRHSSERERIHEYAAGVHLKTLDGQAWPWPHVHLVMVVGGDVKDSKNCSDGIFKRLENTWLRLMPDPRHASVDHQYHGVYGREKLSKTERKRKRRGKIVTKVELTNRIAYVCNINEKVQTLDDCLRRDTVLEKLQLEPTRQFTHSRSLRQDILNSPKKIAVANQFDPVAQGKTSVYVFPFHGPECRRIDPAHWRNARIKLLEEAGQILKQSVAPSNNLTREDM